MVHRAQTGFLILALALMPAACTPSLEYPPPAQRRMPAGPEPAPFGSSVRMDEPTADTNIVQDVLGAEQGASWRWTNQHPRFRIWTTRVEGQTLYVKFTLPGVVLKETGPITIGFLVNDHVLATKSFGIEQRYQYSVPVPPAILKANEPAVVGLDLDRVYVSKTDGMKLGVLIEEIGFQAAGAK